MSDLRLRAACIHGHYDKHTYIDEDAGLITHCPGGREVTIDYEAMWKESQESSYGNLRRPFSDKRRIEMEALFAAAIGDTE